MNITQLYAVNFRNYASLALEINSPVTVFYGKNAQGKTNILEAVFYAAFGISHRAATEDILLKIGSEAMAVGVKYASLSGSHTVKIKKYQTRGRWQKELSLDGAKVRPKEHFGSLNVVLFSPEDLQLVKGEPALRRSFFDLQIAQTDGAYYTLLANYNKVLRQRNQLLKAIREEGESDAALLTWDRQFAALAAAVTGKRIAALAKLRSLASEIYGSISANSEKLALAYEFKGNNGEKFYPDDGAFAAGDLYIKLLEGRRKIDILRGNTGVGPHRDDLVLLLNNMPLRYYGSQGQQRSGALALKLSQLEYVYGEIGEYPVLLLDDVLSELDGSRREHLLKFIDGRVQTFVTVNDKELLPALINSAYFKIENGSVCAG